MNHDAREEDMPSSSSHEPIERRAAMEQPGAAAKASRGERSVFPLPFFACPAKKAPGQECSTDQMFQHKAGSLSIP